jgi:hypothetical protein
MTGWHHGTLARTSTDRTTCAATPTARSTSWHAMGTAFQSGRCAQPMKAASTARLKSIVASNRNGEPSASQRLASDDSGRNGAERRDALPNGTMAYAAKAIWRVMGCAAIHKPPGNSWAPSTDGSDVPRNTSARP